LPLFQETASFMMNTSSGKIAGDVS